MSRLPLRTASPPPVPPPPGDRELEAFLDRAAPLSPVPLCPELRACGAASLVSVWEDAEALAGTTLPSPFWAFPWPAGIALARSILDSPAIVRGRRVIDLGSGGGVTCFACALAGAARVVGCDADPWALAVTRIAAARQHLSVETWHADVARSPELVDEFDVVLCGDLGYDRSTAPRERAALRRAALRGATVLLADAGRTYFETDGLTLLSEIAVPVIRDLEGQDTRTARVFRLPPPSALPQ